MDAKKLRRADRLLWEAKAKIGEAKQLVDGQGFHNAAFHSDKQLDRAIEWIADQLRLTGDTHD